MSGLWFCRPARWRALRPRGTGALASELTYTTETGLAPLSEVANSVKKLPREWINEDGVSMNFQFLRYAQPLIQGEVVVPHDNGVPVFARLDKMRVDKILPGYDV